MIKMFYQNVRSILSVGKRNTLRFVTIDRTYDFMALTETNLNSLIADDQIMSSNYKIIRTDRRNCINDYKK